MNLTVAVTCDKCRFKFTAQKLSDGTCPECGCKHRYHTHTRVEWNERCRRERRAEGVARGN